jgi:hypothetical protein
MLTIRVRAVCKNFTFTNAIKNLQRNSLQLSNFSSTSSQKLLSPINARRVSNSKGPTFDIDNYDCVYQFRYIKHLRFLCRAKIYQTGASIAFGISSIIIHECGLIHDIELLMVTNGLMFFALIMLFAMSRLLVRVVGRIYLSKDGRTFVISHLNFFGKRRDIKMNVEEILPPSSLNELEDKIFKLKIKNLDGSMFVPVRYGNWFNKNAFLKLIKAK